MFLPSSEVWRNRKGFIETISTHQPVRVHASFHLQWKRPDLYGRTALSVLDLHQMVNTCLPDSSYPRKKIVSYTNRKKPPSFSSVWKVWILLRSHMTPIITWTSAMILSPLVFLNHMKKCSHSLGTRLKWPCLIFPTDCCVSVSAVQLQLNENFTSHSCSVWAVWLSAVVLSYCDLFSKTLTSKVLNRLYCCFNHNYWCWHQYTV